MLKSLTNIPGFHLLMALLMLGILSACQPKGGERAALPVINAPNRVASEQVPPDGIVKVQPGDTIYTVANRYGVTPRKIILGNQLTPPYSLDHLFTLILPKPRNHRVKPDDTIDSISARYAVTRHELIRLNQLKEPYQLIPGTTIVIPQALDYSMLDFPGIEPSSSIKVIPGSELPAQPSASASQTTAAVSVPPAGSLAFSWPANGQVIDRFGLVSSGIQNDGINIAGNLGDPIYAAYDGTVAFVGRDLKSFGNMILIKHDNGWITAYAHLGDIQVQEGQAISRGGVIGLMGQSGKVTRPQLHFQIRQSRKPVDPIPYLTS